MGSNLPSNDCKIVKVKSIEAEYRAKEHFRYLFANKSEGLVV